MAKFYLTTTLPYVNDKPHIGFGLEIVQADALARYRRLVGDEVFFNFGTDEHGQKILKEAEKNNEAPQVYADRYAKTFDALKNALNLTYTKFIRTTDAAHKAAAQEMWQRCMAAGDIYKKAYQVKYCVGCELEKTDSELVDGKCPLHPKLDVEMRDEENYFFRFSKYADKLLELYKREDFLIPRFRLNEMISLIEREGLQDFSISRVKAKMSWGVPVPGDGDQVMYVWFDALTNYISTLGWPDGQDFKDYWPGIQFAGKDQVRQQAAMWQAMLMSAGVAPTKQIFIHGFISVDGQKMSKSLGNVIDPIAFAEKYGTDAVRYFLLRHIHPFEDSDFSETRFVELFNANLANGIGNLAARVMTLAQANIEPVFAPNTKFKARYSQAFEVAMTAYDFNTALDLIWASIEDLEKKVGELVVSSNEGIKTIEVTGAMSSIMAMDVTIQKTEPYKAVKENKALGDNLIRQNVIGLAYIAACLEPFMPDTSQKIIDAVLANRKPESLFKRID